MYPVSALWVVVFGLVIAALSSWGIAAPKALIRSVRQAMERRWGMTLAVAARVVLGLSLLVAAPVSGFPTAFEVIGWLTLVAAVALPVVGRRRLSSLLDWFDALPAAFIRLWLIAGLLFGAFLVYAIVVGAG